jgi:hypothetical protein
VKRNVVRQRAFKRRHTTLSFISPVLDDGPEIISHPSTGKGSTPRTKYRFESMAQRSSFSLQRLPRCRFGIATTGSGRTKYNSSSLLGCSTPHTEQRSKRSFSFTPISCSAS